MDTRTIQATTWAPSAGALGIMTKTQGAQAPRHWEEPQESLAPQGERILRLFFWAGGDFTADFADGADGRKRGKEHSLALIFPDPD